MGDEARQLISEVHVDVCDIQCPFCNTPFLVCGGTDVGEHEVMCTRCEGEFLFNKSVEYTVLQ